ncbi:hypothetical protein JV46_29460 [Solemya velum gill symbiont]|uniref:Uncharacterized protein n=1 Tax=Solemya velum gill symbiont TaxID=2340 RepID=A0A0B0H5Q6_SOVGS|nr:hypothetical protein JV46_29460 [Solemya velum gill symbiont]
MISIQNLFSHTDIILDAGTFFPGNICQGIEIIAYNRRFRRHRRHHLELVKLGDRLLLHLFRHSCLLDTLGEFLDFVRRVFHLAELFLNRLHLLIQIVLALVLFHLLLDAATNPLLELQYVIFTFHQPHQVLKTKLDVGDFENLLFLVELQRHVRCHGVSEATWVINTRQRCQHLRRNFLVELDVVVEQRSCRTHQHFHLLLIDCQLLFDGRGRCAEKLFSICEFAYVDAEHALNQHLDSSIRQLQQLQDVGQCTDLVKLFDLRILKVGVALGNEQDRLIVTGRIIECANRFFAPHEKRDNHVRIDNDVTQRQYRDICRNLCNLFFGTLSCHVHLG